MRILNLLTVGGLLALPLLFLTSETAQSTASPSAYSVDGDDPLHEAMEEMQSGMRSLRKLLASPEGSREALELVAKMQANIGIAVAHPPKPLEGISDDDRLTWGSDFKRRVLTIGLKLVDLEEALLKGESESAQAIYKEIGGMKKAGHDKYLPE